MYPEEMIEELEDLGVTYAVFQLEEGKNGTPHYQGYVAFEKKRLTAIEHLLRGAGHWEISRGSPTQNREYCTKTMVASEISPKLALYQGPRRAL